MSITFEKPNTLIEESNKPLVNENSDFPIASIDHRRFEKLIYWIYRKEIQVGTWKELFDDIQLMLGVSDGGKDCALFLKGNMVAVIQCKHSEKDTLLARPALHKEVLKFCLYHIKLKGIIPDIKNFTYYIASSSGFNEDCMKLISNFNTESVSEPKLQTWTESVINSYASIADLVYKDVETELKKLLSELKIKSISNQDINIILNQTYQIDAQKAFFSVRTVVDTAALGPITDKLNMLTESKLSPAEAISAFKSASSYLVNWKNYISEDKKIRILRGQIDVLYNWIKKDLNQKEQPLALLTGAAGAGKTVVLKDLFNKLDSEGIVTLGIKADKYYADNIEGLEKQLDIREPIIKLIQKIREDNEKIVVLIDQIDALSQALSSDRKSLTTYNLLINKLIMLPGVRVIISVREFDLNYDPELSIYKKATKVSLGLLSDVEVKDVLQQLGIEGNSISGKLFNTLKTPHNLEVFNSIYNKNLSLEGLVELQDLYNELWKQKILGINIDSPATKDNCIKLIYEIADEMMSNQKISLSFLNYQNQYENEINYLTSQNIFVVSGKELQFFHQTFFDYSYARNFAEKEKPVIKFLLENNQSLHIRSSLKMILSYLRISDEDKYIKSVEECFSKSGVKFHLRLLIINLLGFNISPLDVEKKFVINVLLKNKEYKKLFIESAFGGSWITFLIENNILNRLIYDDNNLLYKFTRSSMYDKLNFNGILQDRFGLKSYAETRVDNIDLFFNLLHRSLPESRHTISRYLLSITPFGEEKRLVPRLIYALKIWDDESYFQLYNKYKSEIEEDTFVFSHILEDIIPYNIDWVLSTFSKWLDRLLLTDVEKERHKGRIDHSINKFFEALIKHSPEKGVMIGLKFLRKYIETGKFLYKDETLALYDDLKFSHYDYNKERSSGVEEIYSEVVNAIEFLSKNNSDRFNDFIIECKNERSTSILSILVWGFLANPENRKQEIVDFIVWFEGKKGFLHYEKINFWIRRLISKTYLLLNNDQKSTLTNVALAIISDEKPKLYKDEYGNPRYFLRSFGKESYDFLTAIPELEVLNNPKLKKRYQELKRKFGVIEDREVNIISMRGVPEPLESQAYEKMDFDNWEKSMLKYNHDDFDPFSDRGSKLEHSRRFCEEVKKDPGKYFPLVERIIDNNEVDKDYMVKGLEGLKDAEYSPMKVKKLFDKLIVKKLDESNLMYLTWLVDYFIKTKQVDQTLIDFLVNTFHNSPPDNENFEKDPYMKGINSIRGSALDKLLVCTDPGTFIEIIFQTAEVASLERSESIRAVLIMHLPYLLKFDKKRASAIFITAISGVGENVLKTSMRSLGYMVHHRFKELIPFLTNWIPIVSIQKDLGGILVNCWLNSYKDSEKLMYSLLKRSPAARARAVEFSYTNMFHKNQEVAKRCKTLYVYLLKDKSDEVSHEFERMFYEIEKSSFQLWYPLLKLYYKSNAVKNNPQQFFTYLLRNIFQYPNECLVLISNYKKYKRPNMQNGPYYNEEPINIVLNCYNSFLNSGDTLRLERTITLFDRMLKTDYLRKGAYNALYLADV